MDHSLSTLDSSMGSAILNHIQKITGVDLTDPKFDNGYIAGQSVASAVQDLYFNELGGVYNDVDWFVPFAYNSDRTVTSHAHTGVVAEVEYGVMGIDVYSRYRVISSNRDGMLNIIAIEAAPSLLNEPIELLRSFDINEVQVGVDLTTRQLFWTNNFESFLKNRQLEITSYHTSMHTAIRFVAKLRELKNVYGDIGRVMHGVTAFIHAQAQDPAPRHKIALSFGQAMADKFEKVKDTLAPWFTLQEKTDVPEGYPTLFHLVPVRDPDPALVDIIQCYPTAVVAPVIQACTYPFKPALREMLKVLVVGPSLTRATSSYLWINAEDSWATLLSLAGREISLKDAKANEALLNKHPALVLPVGKLSTKVADQVLAWIRRESRTKGEWVVGILENMVAMNAHPLFDTSTQLSEVITVFSKVVAEDEQAVKAELVKRVVPQGLVLNQIPVVQLITVAALRQEGSRMHHCVGGYSGLVRQGHLLISLRGHTAGQSSTAQLNWNRYNMCLDIYQHMGFANAKPPKEHTAALRSAVSKNGELWKAAVLAEYGTTQFWRARLIQLLRNKLSSVKRWIRMQKTRIMFNHKAGAFKFRSLSKNDYYQDEDGISLPF